MTPDNDNFFFRVLKAVLKAIKLSMKVINELQIFDTQSCWLSLKENQNVVSIELK